MKLWELFVVAVGLSMDAFAVSICKGLSAKNIRLKHSAIVGLYFGGFQALMPLLGYSVATRFQSLIVNVDHWIAFVLLTAIGVSMILESRKGCEILNDSFGAAVMIPLAVATSIDALAVGVTFAFLQVRILPAVFLIGVTTFLFSAAGVRIGGIFGTKYKAKSELFGGLVLILMGVKILVEHLGLFR